jgi:GNAT superfamily N-acetyltransferase
MLEPEGRYLIVYPVGGTEPVGMTYFQFVLEDDGDSDDNKQLGCIYWLVGLGFLGLFRYLIFCCSSFSYEIQLTPGIQGKGIGSHLMHLLEDMGRRLGMRKCMLTVLRSECWRYIAARICADVSRPLQSQQTGDELLSKTRILHRPHLAL